MLWPWCTWILCLSFLLRHPHPGCDVAKPSSSHPCLVTMLQNSSPPLFPDLDAQASEPASYRGCYIADVNIRDVGNKMAMLIFWYIQFLNGCFSVLLFSITRTNINVPLTVCPTLRVVCFLTSSISLRTFCVLWARCNSVTSCVSSCWYVVMIIII